MNNPMILFRESYESGSAQPEAAGDDAAQDLAGAAAQGLGRRVQYGLRQYLLEPVIGGAAAGRRQPAHELGDLALEGIAEMPGRNARRCASVP